MGCRRDIDILVEIDNDASVLFERVGLNFLKSPWFTDPTIRRIYSPEEREQQGRDHVADLRASVARRGNDAASTRLVARLREVSAEFTALWSVARPIVGMTTDSRSSGMGERLPSRRETNIELPVIDRSILTARRVRIEGILLHIHRVTLADVVPVRLARFSSSAARWMTANCSGEMP